MGERPHLAIRSTLPRRERERHVAKHCETIVIRDNLMYAAGGYVKVEVQDGQSGESSGCGSGSSPMNPARRVVFGTLDSELP